MANEPLWLQSPPQETSPESWLRAGDAILNLIPDFESFEALPKPHQLLVFALMDTMLRCGREAARVDPELARRWLQKKIGDPRAQLGEFYLDF